jgi:two-component system sensor histidine kinase/response regulator
MMDQLTDNYQRSIQQRSDRLINYFLAAFYSTGLVLAGFYGTWIIAVGIGTLCLAAYYSVKWLLPASDLYQYVLSVVLAVFMAQFIYQMHACLKCIFLPLSPVRF